MSVRQCVERFGALTSSGQIDWENSLGGWLRTFWDSGQTEERVVVTQLIVPNPDAKPNPIDPMDRPYLSYTYLNRYANSTTGVAQHWPNRRNAALQRSNSASTGDDTFVLEISGYEYFPVIAARWEEIPNEAYGVDGPMDIAHSDVLTLQEEQRYRLEGIGKLVRPPFIGPANLAQYRVSSAPGGITYFDERSDAQLRPLFQVDPKLHELVRSQEETDQFIKEAFYVDLFRPLSQQDPKSHISVVEIQKRASESLQLISAPLSNMDDDINDRVVENKLFLLGKMGILPPPPEDSGEAIIPEYISVLAQATKINQATTSERFLNFAATTSEALQDRSLLNVPDGEKVIRHYGRVLGVDPMIIRSEEDVEDIRQEQAAMAQQDESRQQQMEDVQMAKDMASPAASDGPSVADKLKEDDEAV